MLARVTNKMTTAPIGTCRRDRGLRASFSCACSASSIDCKLVVRTSSPEDPFVKLFFSEAFWPCFFMEFFFPEGFWSCPLVESSSSKGLSLCPFVGFFSPGCCWLCCLVEELSPEGCWSCCLLASSPLESFPSWPSEGSFSPEGCWSCTTAGWTSSEGERLWPVVEPISPNLRLVNWTLAAGIFSRIHCGVPHSGLQGPRKAPRVSWGKSCGKNESNHCILTARSSQSAKARTMPRSKALLICPRPPFKSN
mmetsp:Transcript_69028/g.173940  ORF Transcript_69028/g.173940 Transcript_69028/m.173940 type:complete len:251 (+) Transcript_69028:655-1407(+)